MFYCTTKGLNDSREGQNSSRLKGCLSLHLEVIFHPAYRHIWATFCSPLNKRCFMIYHKAHAKSSLSSRLHVPADAKTTGQTLCYVRGKTSLVLLKKASASASSTRTVRNRLYLTSHNLIWTIYTIKDSETNKCTAHLQKTFLWFYCHLQRSQCF